MAKTKICLTIIESQWRDEYPKTKSEVIEIIEKGSVEVAMFMNMMNGVF